MESYFGNFHLIKKFNYNGVLYSPDCILGDNVFGAAMPFSPCNDKKHIVSFIYYTTGKSDKNYSI